MVIDNSRKGLGKKPQHVWEEEGPGLGTRSFASKALGFALIAGWIVFPPENLERQ